jgi:hypothetical protein
MLIDMLYFSMCVRCTLWAAALVRVHLCAAFGTRCLVGIVEGGFGGPTMSDTPTHQLGGGGISTGNATASAARTNGPLRWSSCMPAALAAVAAAQTPATSLRPLAAKTEGAPPRIHYKNLNTKQRSALR